MASQAADGTISWTLDFSKHLAQPVLTGVTIVDATVTCDAVGVAIGGSSFTDTSVSWQMSGADFAAAPEAVPVVVTVTLSNGDTDPRTVFIQLTKTGG